MRVCETRGDDEGMLEFKQYIVVALTTVQFSDSWWKYSQASMILQTKYPQLFTVVNM